MDRSVSDSNWQTHARASLRRQRAAWLGTIATAMVSGGFLGIGVVLDPGLARMIVIAIGLLLIIASLVWGTLIYMQVIDEQERDANLWGCYVGMVVYLGLFVARMLGELFGAELPIDDSGIFTATMATVLIVFVWKRFR